mmetsp:Transcript_14183/g.40703  ORF Transcript_14183/g.40703 Transcript_14183/m.40703 type:complete len:483 (-) Transcript_14183:86-1534(-)
MLFALSSRNVAAGRADGRAVLHLRGGRKARHLLLRLLVIRRMRSLGAVGRQRRHILVMAPLGRRRRQRRGGKVRRRVAVRSMSRPMAVRRSERSMKRPGGRPWAEGACRRVVPRMPIDTVGCWMPRMAVRREVSIAVGSMGPISVGRTGARCWRSAPGRRPRTCDGMTGREVRGTIINLDLVQRSLGGLLDVLGIDIQPAQNGLLAVNFEEKSSGLRDGIERLALILTIVAIVPLGDGSGGVGNTALDRLLLLRRAAARIVLVSTIFPRADGTSPRTLWDGRGRCAVGSSGKPDVYRAPGELVVQLLLAAVGAGIVLLLARGADGRRRGDLLLLADGLVKVEGDCLERSVDDATGLGVDTGFVEGNANIRQAPGTVGMAIAHAAQLARLVVLLAANADGQALFGEGQRDGVGETGEGRRERVDRTIVLVGVWGPHMRADGRTWRMNAVAMSCARRDGREDHDEGYSLGTVGGTRHKAVVHKD